MSDIPAFDLNKFLEGFPDMMSMRFAQLFLDMDNTRISRASVAIDPKLITPSDIPADKIPGIKSASGSWTYRKVDLMKWKIANAGRRRAVRAAGKSFVFKIIAESADEIEKKAKEISAILEPMGYTLKPLYNPNRRKTPVGEVKHRTRIADPANIKTDVQEGWGRQSNPDERSPQITDAES